MKKTYSFDFVPDGSKLTFVRLANRADGGNAVAIYRCVCGVEKEIRSTHVKLGKVRSCGCIRSEAAKSRVRSEEEKARMIAVHTTHGLSKHPIYGIYYGILDRCENKNEKAYKWYGARGVKMCEEWRTDFKKFYDWCMDNGWSKGMEIDKDIIPRRLGVPALIYSPEMCSIVTEKENMNAHGDNRIVEYLGRKQTLSQWADEYGVNYKKLWSRLKLGFDFELALTRPNRTIQETSALNRRVILNTQTGIYYFGAKEAAESHGINTNTLHCKLMGRSKNNTPFIYA